MLIPPRKFSITRCLPKLRPFLLLTATVLALAKIHSWPTACSSTFLPASAGLVSISTSGNQHALIFPLLRSTWTGRQIYQWKCPRMLCNNYRHCPTIQWGKVHHHCGENYTKFFTVLPVRHRVRDFRAEKDEGMLWTARNVFQSDHDHAWEIHSDTGIFVPVHVYTSQPWTQGLNTTPEPISPLTVISHAV